MIAGLGDSAFVMLLMFPGKAARLFLLLFLYGIVFGRLLDTLVPVPRIRPCEKCVEQEGHAGPEGLAHYLGRYVWQHIVKRHLLNVF